MKRRDALKSIGAGAVSTLAFPAVRTRAARSTRPNILFIMADDHAAQAMSCYGSRINRTPHLDRIADEGMRFDNCFCTNSICAPSRAVILSGKYSHLNGVIDNVRSLDPATRLYPHTLREAGYRTAMIGKWHLKSDPVGFDYWNILPGQGDYYNPELIEMGERKKHNGYVTDIITDISLNWLEGNPQDSPFCLIYQHKAPHRNWLPGPNHLTMYDGEDIPEPETLFDDYATRSDAAREQAMSIAEHLTPIYDLKQSPPSPENEQERRQLNNLLSRLTEDQKRAWRAAYEPRNEAFRRLDPQGRDLVRWKYQRYVKDYLRCVASVDDNVGRVLDYLDDSGRAENTIVVYTSDQGFYLGEHGWFDKRFMYEESLRMPLLVRYPGTITPGSVSDDIAVNIDFAPTFLDFADAPIPSDMQGRSLRPILEGTTPQDWRNSMYYHYYAYPFTHSVKRHYGVRTKRYKLIHFYYDIDAWELYDLEKDPRELNNLYGDPAYASVTRDLTTELDRLRKHYGDTEELSQRFLREHLESMKK
jgi:arylsulfatase A-like enzyme